MKYLNSELEMLSLVASKTTNSVIITDSEDRIEWVNDAFTRITGFPLSRAKGQFPGDLLQGPKTSPATVKRIETNRKAKVSFAEEILNYTIAGEELWFLMEVTPVLDQQGNLVRTIVILTDITEKKRTEEDLYKLAQDLSRQNQDLQQFTYMVSHNLRAPIANAMGLIEVLGSIEKTDPFFDDSMAMLQSSVKHLEQITADMNSILTFRDKNNLRSSEEINLHTLINDAVKDFDDYKSSSVSEIVNKVPAEICFKANRGFLHNVFTNLLSNAIKYRSDDRKLKVMIEARLEGGNVQITVSDNGIGFNAFKVKNQLFKLYKRFHSDRGEGRGIGLFLVKTAVDAMNGNVYVESIPGEGTTFRIIIPEQA